MAKIKVKKGPENKRHNGFLQGNGLGYVGVYTIAAIIGILLNLVASGVFSKEQKDFEEEMFTTFLTDYYDGTTSTSACSSLNLESSKTDCETDYANFSVSNSDLTFDSFTSFEAVNENKYYRVYNVTYKIKNSSDVVEEKTATLKLNYILSDGYSLSASSSSINNPSSNGEFKIIYNSFKVN